MSAPDSLDQALAVLAAAEAEYNAQRQHVRRLIGLLIENRRCELGYTREAAGALLGLGRQTIYLAERPRPKQPLCEKYTAEIYRSLCKLPPAPQKVRGFRRRALQPLNNP